VCSPSLSCAIAEAADDLKRFTRDKEAQDKQQLKERQSRAAAVDAARARDAAAACAADLQHAKDTLAFTAPWSSGGHASMATVATTEELAALHRSMIEAQGLTRPTVLAPAAVGDTEALPGMAAVISQWVKAFQTHAGKKGRTLRLCLAGCLTRSARL